MGGRRVSNVGPTAQAFAGRFAECHGLSTLERIEREARALDDRHIREFLVQLPSEIADHQRRLSDVSPLRCRLEGERVDNAKAVAARLAAPAGPLVVLGCGAEGVALSDGTHVFKVFDYWKSLHVASTTAFLRSLVGAWTDARCLYPPPRVPGVRRSRSADLSIRGERSLHRWPRTRHGRAPRRVPAVRCRLPQPPPGQPSGGR